MGLDRRWCGGSGHCNRIRRTGFLPFLVLLAVSLLSLGISAAAPGSDSFRFAIFGDRTGEARPDVYGQVWREAALEDPAFVVTTGDTIEGSHDATASGEWQEIDRALEPYRRFPLYFTPGNHDIWSAASQQLFTQHAGHPPHYSFDQGQVHVTILDNSRSAQLSAAELIFFGRRSQSSRCAAHKVYLFAPAVLADQRGAQRSGLRLASAGPPIRGEVRDCRTCPSDAALRS
jgi:hypothetical protein